MAGVQHCMACGIAQSAALHEVLPSQDWGNVQLQRRLEVGHLVREELDDGLVSANFAQDVHRVEHQMEPRVVVSLEGKGVPRGRHVRVPEALKVPKELLGPLHQQHDHALEGRVEELRHLLVLLHLMEREMGGR